MTGNKTQKGNGGESHLDRPRDIGSNFVMMAIPHSAEMDATLALYREGYRFIANRCEKLNSEIFETRLILQKTLCMRGREAARLFYDRDRFTRIDATPGRVQKTLFGQGGVQSLDGESHHQRKALFMSLMSNDSLERLIRLLSQQWQSRLAYWTRRDEIQLYGELSCLLCQVACEWLGVPLREAEVTRRTQQMQAMIAGGAAVLPGYLKARLARRQAERWAGQWIRAVRTGQLEVDSHCGLYAIAWHRDRQNKLLDEPTAAVELLNLLRPTIAVARYGVFIALALHEHPEQRKALRDLDFGAEPINNFVQEVRRYYPFFPFVAARVRQSFKWQGHPFPRGRRVLLDLYGTNHDPGYWQSPGVFRPERFQTEEQDDYALIPQGGGDYFVNHRCAGEWITIKIMKTLTRCFLETMDYTVPNQDLDIDLSRIPALPGDGLRIRPVPAG